MIKTSKKIDILIESMDSQGIDISEFSDISISVDGDDPTYLVELSLELGKKLGRKTVFRTAGKYGYYYFIGSEKHILEKLRFGKTI